MWTKSRGVKYFPKALYLSFPNTNLLWNHRTALMLTQSDLILIEQAELCRISLNPNRIRLIAKGKEKSLNVLWIH
jgi:hypothetical protein